MILYHIIMNVYIMIYLQCIASHVAGQHESLSILLATLQPCFIFVGEGFESNPELRMAKSLLLDFFRGRQIDAINLKVIALLDCANYIGISECYNNVY